MRVNGLALLVGIVALGIGSGSAYYHYKQPKLAAELQAQIDAAPKSPEGKLQQWHLIGSAQIHHRLTQFAQFDPPERPWLVTHAISSDAGPPELWGIDCVALPQRVSRIEGMTVVIELPAPHALGTGDLDADQFEYIPLYEAGRPIPDPGDRLRKVALHLLGGIPGALERDIEGASIEIRVAG